MFNQARYAEMEAFARKMTMRFPSHGIGWKAMGTALLQQGRNEEALAHLQKAAELSQGDAQPYNNLGNTFVKLGRLPEAETSYRQALRLDPGFVEANHNLGNTLLKQGRLLEAEACYRHALEFKPNFVEAHCNLGNALQKQGRMSEAETSFRRALELKPDYAEAHCNLGVTLNRQGRLPEAEASYCKALQINPGYADALNNLGVAMIEASRHEEAVVCFKKLLSINPDYPFAFGMYLHSRMHCCYWEEIDEAFLELAGRIDAGKEASHPFCLLAIPSTPVQQKRCAEIYVRKHYPVIQAYSEIRGQYSHGKVRLGYFSSDFYNHATAFLMAELIELHDRSRFEVFGFSYGAFQDDDMRQRVSAAFDRFIDVKNQSDQDIVALAKSLEIDIAIDLKGFTKGHRTGIFALRPAPIQVSYLGYPGTMGAPYIDYLIADPTLIPVETRQYYSEKIAYLPDSYQVNDSHKQISEYQFTRREAGLPDEGFVFCCFNNNYKITPAIFDIWMQLLKQVEGSVLWLFEGNARVEQNLRNEAMKRGIAPERIVFAKRMGLPDHLARHRLADLFLDTFFYNAHTTASDALWAGLPVITCPGDTFAGRVAASLLDAIGLPELIAHSHEEYTAFALELATNPEKLALIKQKLAKNRATHPLFNTTLFTYHIEDVFTQMWEKHQNSLPPEHVYARTAK